ncbi:ATP-NAD kinase [Suillus brevipes Sb2]|nr:ATP-NAD kinase [Suillus brevipes Sb2]
MQRITSYPVQTSESPGLFNNLDKTVGVREMSKQLGRARIRSNIQSVLIVTKARDNRLIKLTRELALYLTLKHRQGSRGLIVYVDHQLRHSRRFDAEGIQRDHPEFDMYSNSPHLFDFVITLGRDGTVLFTPWLFQRIVPPVLPFALGSLGFLTNFDFADYQTAVDSAIDSGIRVNLHMRFTCTVYRAVFDKGKFARLWLVRRIYHLGGRQIMCFTTKPVEMFEVLNDLVIDRGPSPYVSLLELFGDEHHMTIVQAHGLCAATPTGSTAYSLSAGGSLVHPEIPAILISPICSHTPSFCPMLLLDNMELRICIPYNSHSMVWLSFDGRGRVELQQGDHIKITASNHPFPTVCAD